MQLAGRDRSREALSFYPTSWITLPTQTRCEMVGLARN